jgi:hypothetical protein
LASSLLHFLKESATKQNSGVLTFLATDSILPHKRNFHKPFLNTLVQIDLKAINARQFQNTLAHRFQSCYIKVISYN